MTTTMPLLLSRRRALALGLGATALLLPGVAGCAGPSGEGLSEAAVGAALEPMLAAGAVGVLAEVRSGEQSVAASAAGSGQSAPDPGSSFRVASITKSMVAVLVLQQVGEGRIALDDPVRSHLPQLPEPAGPWTVRQLLNHTSGLPDNDVLFPTTMAGAQELRTTTYTDDELVQQSLGQPWLGEPGDSTLRYSNTGYVVLAQVLAAVTDQPVSELFRQRIARPAGLEQTIVPEDASMPAGSIPGWMVQGADREELSEVDPSVFSWGANVISTCSDLNRFYRATFDGTLLSPDLAEEMRSGPGSYRLGLLTSSDPCGLPLIGRTFGNRGNGWGYSAASFHSDDGARQISLGWSGTGPLPSEDPILQASLGVIQELLGLTC